MGKKKQKISAESFKEQGNKAFNNNDLDRALLLYTKGLELEPNHAVLYSNRSAVYIAQNKYEEALADASKSISLDTSYMKADFRKVSALTELSRFEEALAVITEALSIQPNFSELLELKKEIEEELRALNVLPLDHPERVKFNNLVNWLKSGNSEFPKLEMRFYSQDYRGVHCTSFAHKDECLLFVPKSHIITLEMAKATPIGSKMVQADLDLLSPKHCFLTTFILQERRIPNSFWEPYLNILPEKLANFPIFFTDDEKAWLEGSPFLDQVNEKISDIQEDYGTICRAVPEYSQFPIEEFSKVRMAVSSRIFGMVIDSEKTDGFVPLADMLNHRRPRQTSWNYDQDKGGFIIEALENIKRGEEVLDSYGKKCNSRFLLNYGFINRNNDANEYPFKVVLTEKHEGFAVKNNLIGTKSQTFRLQTDLYEPVFNEFLSTMRFVELDDMLKIPELLHKCQDEKGLFKSTKVPPISLQNEVKVIEKLREMALEGMAKYPNTLEEDAEILKGELTENQRNCTLMRQGEKIILKFFIELTEFVLPLFSLSIKQIKQKSKNSNFEEYINNSLLVLKKQ